MRRMPIFSLAKTRNRLLAAVCSLIAALCCVSSTPGGALASGRSGLTRFDVLASPRDVPVLTSVTVSPSPAMVQTGASQTFTAVALDQNGDPMVPQPASFTWTVSGGGIIDANGFFVAYNTPGGPFTVTAATGGISGITPLTVTIGNPYSGTPVSLPGLVEAENYDNGGEGIAYHDLDTANQGGAYRPTEGVDLENSSDTGGGYDIGWIKPGEWTNYTVDVAKAGTYALSARVASPNDGTSLHFEIGGVNISGSIAVPNTGGGQTWQTVTANNITLAAGRQVIKMVAEAAASNPTYLYSVNSFTVSGLPQVLTSITVAPSTATVNTGTTQQYTATALDQYGIAMSTQPTMTWTVSGGGTIDANGLFTAGSTGGGPFTVTAASGSVSGTAAATVVFVQVLTTVTVSPPTATVHTGAVQHFGASAKDQAGNPMSTQPVFTWTVSGGGVIDFNGKFTAGSTVGGPFTVTAAAGGKSGTATLSVTPAPVLTSIVVSPATGNVQTGAIKQFTAVAKDQNGIAMSPAPVFTWTVSGGGTVDANGLFTAGTVPGPVTITATNGAVSGTAAVVVQSASQFDFNGDGKPDLILQQGITNQVALWYMNGTALVSGAYAPVTPPANWKVVASGDFNNDGYPDIVLQNVTTRQIAFWFMKGDKLAGSAYASAIPPVGWRVQAAGDFDKDGNPDLVLVNASALKVAIWHFSGTNVLNGIYLATPLPSGYSVVGEGDFNGDGKLDLVLQSAATRKVMIWYVTGIYVNGGKIISLTPPAGFRVLGTYDFNRDGKPDIVLQSFVTRQIAFWYMNNDTVSSGAYVSQIPAANWSVVGPR